MLRINEIKSKSGSLNNLDLEIVDSKAATNRHKIKIFKKNINNANTMLKKPIVVSIPHGKNKFAPSVRKIKNLLAEVHSIRASLLPEYSKIIASCIIVNSRCVDGLSKGYRAVSESIAIMKAKNARSTGIKEMRDMEEIAFRYYKKITGMSFKSEC
jgi:hypothetical protein